MYALIRSMVAAKYNGSIILDHTPSFEEFAGGHAGATSYAVVRNFSPRTPQPSSAPSLRSLFSAAARLEL
jgi:hypothetical protein